MTALEKNYFYQMDQIIQEFQKLLIEALGRPMGLSSQGEAVAAEIMRRLELDANSDLSVAHANPLKQELNYVAEHIDELPGSVRGLTKAVLALSGHLPWYQRSAPGNSAFEAGHANAEIIGPKGLIIRDDVIVGVTLMRPRVTYPDHHHYPEEIYIVLSEGQWRQRQDLWKTPGAGGYIYNPCNILHAMKSEKSPLFAIWCLKP